MVLLSVGLITSFMIAVLPSLPPIIDIAVSGHEVLRVYPPIAYTFCIQQYRNYDGHIFSYALALGWPDGIPIVQTATMDDQSEFMHEQRYSIGLVLGMLLLLGMIALVGVLTLIDRRQIPTMHHPAIVSAPILVFSQLLLILLITFPFLGSLYVLGGVSVLILTLCVTVREYKSRESEEVEHT